MCSRPRSAATITCPRPAHERPGTPYPLKTAAVSTSAPVGCPSTTATSHPAASGTPDVEKFAHDLEKVCVDTVEAGHMTKDLAVLIGPDQPWMNTNQFLDKLDQNLKAKMAA
jgi:hypothetical protein